MRKTVLFLGASFQQLAPLEYARGAGYRVITCDNRPANPGHRLADASYEVSTVDFEGILRVASRERVDAVVCYASDVAAPTAAYVAEQLGVPGNPLQTVRTLTDKGRFRQFQLERGYLAPPFLIFSREEIAGVGAEQVQNAVTRALKLPVVVKPTDAAGCKGVSKVHAPDQLASALSHAARFSRSGELIVEEMMVPLGYQVCGEGFLQEGRIIFHALANEHFSPESVVPVGESFPCVFDERLVDKAVDTLQSIFSDVGMLRGPFNVDLMLTPSEDVFVIEIGPRNGGNRMPDAIKYANRADTIAATVESALGRPVELVKHTDGFYSTYSVHSKRSGVLESIRFAECIRRRIVDEQIFCAPGDVVESFTMGSLMLGNLILGFDDYTDMLSSLDHMDDYVTIELVDGER